MYHCVNNIYFVNSFSMCKTLYMGLIKTVKHPFINVSFEYIIIFAYLSVGMGTFLQNLFNYLVKMTIIGMGIYTNTLFNNILSRILNL